MLERPSSSHSYSDAISALMGAISPVVIIAPHVLTRIVADVGLDPSAVVAVSTRLAPRQLSGVLHLPLDLPGLATNPELGIDLRDLDDETRSIAALAALAVVDRADVLLAAAGLSPEEWVTLPVARYLTFCAGRFAFRNPRLRAVLRETMSSAESLVAHDILASTYSSAGLTDAALWHRTMASTSLDPARAPALNDLAQRLLRTGDAVHAYEVAVVAADHAPQDDGPTAATAAKAAFHAGYFDSARSWFQRGHLPREVIARAAKDVPGEPPESDRDQRLLPNPAPPTAPGIWPRDDHPGPTPLERANAVVAHCLSLSAAGDLGEAHEMLLRAAYQLPLAITSRGVGAALAQRLDVAVTGQVGPTATALNATSPHRNSPGLRLSALVDGAIGAALAGNLERARVLLAIERQRSPELPRLPIRGFNDLEAWMLTAAPEASGAPPDLARATGSTRDADSTHGAAAAQDAGSTRDPRWMWAQIMLAGSASPAEMRSAEESLAWIESPYERAHAELCAAAAFTHLGDPSSARAHLIAASAEFTDAGTPAFRDLAERLLHDRPQGPAVSGTRGSAVGSAGTPARLERRVRGPWESLTDRETQVAQVLASGASNREIARTLGLSIRTVEVHLSRIYRKLGVRSRVEYLLLPRDAT